MGRKCSAKEGAQGKWQVEIERERRDIMKETGRLIHILRQESLKRR